MGVSAQSYEPTTHAVGLAPQGLSDHVVDATTRERRIRGVLAALDRPHEAILRIAYSWPNPRLARLDAELVGELGGVVAYTIGIAALDWVIRAARAGQREPIEMHRANAIASIRAAQAAYVRAAKVMR